MPDSKLCLELKKSVVAADAAIESFVVNIVLAAERPLGGFMAGYLILQRAQLLSPFVVGLVNFLDDGGDRFSRNR